MRSSLFTECLLDILPITKSVTPNSSDVRSPVMTNSIV